jgi:hypothetical protein
VEVEQGAIVGGSHSSDSGSGQVLAVVEEPLVRDLRRIDLLRTLEHMYLPESLPAQLTQAAPQIAVLPGDDGAPEVPVGPDLGPLPAQRLGHVEHDGDRQHVMLPGDPHERGPGVRLYVGRVDHGEPAEAQTDAGDVVQRVECRGGGRLVVLVVGDHAAEGIRGEHPRRREVPAGEGRLAGSGDADQDDEREIGDVQVGHQADPFVKTAICVGAPTCGSSSPTPRSAAR